jgi:hypothetical protein
MDSFILVLLGVGRALGVLAAATVGIAPERIPQ